MKPTKIRFLSANKFKLAEAEEILKPAGISVVSINFKIDELQTEDMNDLVRDKLVKAFYKCGRPLFVEHTGLRLEHLNGFPGGLTQIFWDTLQADRFAELFGNTRNTKVTAETIVAYTDGHEIHQFSGTIDGTIAKEPRGNQDFQWDCVFIPNGYDKTFSELGPKKNEISMRKQALQKLADHLLS